MVRCDANIRDVNQKRERPLEFNLFFVLIFLTMQDTAIDVAMKQHVSGLLKRNFLLHHLSEFYPLLGRSRSRGKCWAAIPLSHRPEPSGHAVHGEVDGLDIGRQHGRRFVLLRHSHRPQRGHIHLCQQERERPTLVRRRISPVAILEFKGGGTARPRKNYGGKPKCLSYIVIFRCFEH